MTSGWRSVSIGDIPSPRISTMAESFMLITMTSVPIAAVEGDRASIYR